LDPIVQERENAARQELHETERLGSCCLGA
jgi:hypothetical protein